MEAGLGREAESTVTEAQRQCGKTLAMRGSTYKMMSWGSEAAG